MSEKSSSQPTRFILLDEGSPQPMKVDAVAFFEFEARGDRLLEKLLARWELRGRSQPNTDRRFNRPAK